MRALLLLVTGAHASPPTSMPTVSRLRPTRSPTKGTSPFGTGGNDGDFGTGGNDGDFGTGGNIFDQKGANISQAGAGPITFPTLSPTKTPPPCTSYINTPCPTGNALLNIPPRCLMCDTGTVLVCGSLANNCPGLTATAAKYGDAGNPMCRTPIDTGACPPTVPPTKSPTPFPSPPTKLPVLPPSGVPTKVPTPPPSQPTCPISMNANDDDVFNSDNCPHFCAALGTGCSQSDSKSLHNGMACACCGQLACAPPGTTYANGVFSSPTKQLASGSLSNSCPTDVNSDTDCQTFCNSNGNNCFDDSVAGAESNGLVACACCGTLTCGPAGTTYSTSSNSFSFSDTGTGFGTGTGTGSGNDPNSKSATSSSSTGAIVGGVIAALVVVGVAVGGFVYFNKTKGQNSKHKPLLGEQYVQMREMNGVDRSHSKLVAQASVGAL